MDQVGHEVASLELQGTTNGTNARVSNSTALLLLKASDGDCEKLLYEGANPTQSDEQGLNALYLASFLDFWMLHTRILIARMERTR